MTAVELDWAAAAVDEEEESEPEPPYCGEARAEVASTERREKEASTECMLCGVVWCGVVR